MKYKGLNITIIVLNELITKKCFFRYGVKGTFSPEDLNEGKNLVKVTKAVEELADLVNNYSSSFLPIFYNG